MLRRIRVLMLVVVCCLLALPGASSPVAAQSDSTMPAYFIAIHCEPNQPQNYPVLQEMVEYADDYDIKLTIMLTAQWTDYIMTDPARLAEVQGWMEDGHEIAAHHHSIYHGSWDGYTDFSRAAVEAAGNSYDAYLGSLDDYVTALYRVSASVQSGCVNDERSKQAMPDDIIYDTCSGFANTGEPGSRLNDRSAEKGINEFITVGTVNGVTRKWLTHYQIYQNPLAAMAAVNGMEGGVYGVVTHAALGQDQPLYDFMDFLHARDPEAALSRTVSSAIEEESIPEIVLPDEIINAEYPDERPPASERLCGDGVCDARERENPDLCPLECEGDTPADSPFGFHPANVRKPGYADNGFTDAQNIGVDWTRQGLYAFWFIIQPDLAEAVYDFTLYDQQWGDVPADMEILANIAPQAHIDEGRCLPGSWLPVNVPSYTAFVRATVERYDGDGIDDMPGLTNPITYWQVGNEPNIQARSDFADLQLITYQAIKEACTDCSVLIGGVAGFPAGYVAGFDQFYAPILAELNGQGIDVFDFHWYGDALGEYRLADATTGEDVLDHIRATLTNSGFSSTLPIWITEMGSYSGDPAGGLLPQSERQQAGDYFKRFIYSLSRGVEKVFPAFGLIEGFKHDDGYFDHTGLIYDGEDSGDLGLGIRKLSYYTYKKMTEELSGVDWDTLTLLHDGTDGDHLYLVRVIRDGAPVYTAWWDYFDEPGYTAGDTKPITLTGLNGTAITVTTMVSAAEVGQDVSDYATAFARAFYPIADGQATFVLGVDPVLVEGIDATSAYLPVIQASTEAIPPVYVTFFSHNESTGYWTNLIADEAEYDVYRTDLVGKIELLHEYGVTFNWETDSDVLLAMKKWEIGERLKVTNDKNILRWMVEDMGMVIDPHGAKDARYTYADLAYMIEEFDVDSSGVVGGFVLYRCEDGGVGQVDWKDVIEIESDGLVWGRQHPDYSWQPVILGQPAMIGHTFDEFSSGVWKPADGDFLQHDPGSEYIYVGQGYPHTTDLIGPTNSGGATIWYSGAEYVMELLSMIQSGELPADAMYTASVHFRDHPLVTTYDDLERVLDAFKPLVDAGQVVYMDYESVAGKWQSEHGSEPSRVDIADFSVYDDIMSQVCRSD